MMFRSLRKYILRYYRTKIRKDEKTISYYKFLECNGEKTLRLDYPLNSGSLVIDAGGYLGDFTADIVCKFDCRVIIFEPVSIYADYIEERFKYNPKVTLIRAAIGAKNGQKNINIEGSSSSFLYGKNQKQESVKILSVVEFLTNIEKVDLFKINIEGAEYEVLNAILNEDQEIARKVKYFQIQFHDFIENAKALRNNIRQRLQRTHELIWDFPFIWESWKIKQEP